VVVVLLSLLLFFVLYVGLVIGSAYLTYKAITYPLPRGSQGGAVLLKIGLACCSALLFLFLLKGFFKRSRREKTLEVEITETDQPRLFDFLEELCAETGAALPHRVFVNPEVNASVRYNSTVLSLFWPTPKNLLVGLGLVNLLNLTELKAVLAHEFGHFSQRSMKVGGYVYAAQRIIADLVYGRDWLDDLLDRWCCIDIRFSWPGWAFKGILWALRKLLSGLFHAIIFLHSALSRQMELHADLVAVSVTGSDATAHVLARLRFAEEALMQACRDLQAAADHKLYSNNLFLHQERAAEFLRKIRKDPTLGEPPVLSADPNEVTYVFQPGEEGTPSMWATHPSNYDREHNAKRCYIRSEFDVRSPWLLFDNAEQLREQVTWRFYRVVMKAPREVVVADARDVQAFIDEEHAETTYDPRYHGLYDGRWLEPGAVDDLVGSAAAEPWDTARLRRAHALLYSGELEAWMKEHNQRLDEYNLLLGVSRGTLKPQGSELEFRGKFYQPREVERLLKRVDGELEEDQRWLVNLDRKVFLIHYQMAQHAGQQASAQELAERYRFHLSVQQLLRDLIQQENTVGAALQFLSGKRQLQPEHFREALAIFRKARNVLADSLSAARDLPLPALKNMNAGEPLRAFLLEKRLVYELQAGEQRLEGEWINKFLQQQGEVLDKLRRIHFKSLGGILSLQEKITAPFLAQPPEEELSVEVLPDLPATGGG
jgi:Zn-dependent protease with chaperone function